ncbi:class A beta-lactamase [Ancylobacter amanitiformis]|uniref:beta-lactamase n=1 Tax=Ancylobacter amanitiformis TaxID=217069 RepID=A0ABU0LKG1_9HYPH|nr:class A beta-lactamase [Ancylobacter amanitiformis]MDQ0509195.1 beta-lactamase class A [Ancylobacter amanitiformis]
MPIDRRRFALSLLSTVTVAAAALAPRPACAAAPAPAPRDALLDAFAAIEREAGGARLGVAVIDTASRDAAIGYHAQERFPLLSSFKLLAGAAVLAKVDAGQDRLDRRVTYDAASLVPYSPETSKHVAEGMTLDAICAAAIALSDNTAGNLQLHAIGGPPGLTAFLRGLGDPVTRLDRWEPELNAVGPGEERDTTTPAAMAQDVARLIAGEALSPASRERLAAWLVASTTGGKRLRAGFPAQWRMGDKTGTTKGSANDVAIIWPPDRAPIVIAAYLKGSPRGLAENDPLFAAIGQAVASYVKG